MNSEKSQIIVPFKIDENWTVIQGCIEMISKQLMRHDETGIRIDGRRLSDFDIKYKTEMLARLITIRERLCEEVEKLKNQ